jgi:hypothetical protein
MGMRATDGVTPTARQGSAKPGAAAEVRARAGAEAQARPPLVLLAVAVLAVEALGLFAAGVLNVIDMATGQTYQVSNGIALIVLEIIMIGGLAWIARALMKVRPWTRTPSVMIQVFVAVIAVYLLQAHRYDWGVPTLVLALAGLAGLLHPASFRALARPMPPAPAANAPRPAKRSQSAKSAQSAKPARSGNSERSAAAVKGAKSTKGGSARGKA